MRAKTREKPSGKVITLPARPTPLTTSPNLTGPLSVHGWIWAPDNHRVCWKLCYVCPWCECNHFGRDRDPGKLTGERQTGCGKLVNVLATHVYRGEG